MLSDEEFERVTEEIAGIAANNGAPAYALRGDERRRAEHSGAAPAD